MPSGVEAAAPQAPPRILSIDFDPHVVHPGQTISGTVLTTSNVASVEVRIAGYGATMSKDGPGQFSLRYTIGQLPFFLYRTYTMTIVARNTRGDAATQSVPITIR